MHILLLFNSSAREDSFLKMFPDTV